MESNSKLKWEAHLANCSLNEAKIILVLEYLLLLLFSKLIIFLFYFVMIFSLSYYFVNFKEVSPNKMYFFSFILHFILFCVTDIITKDSREIDEIKEGIKETKNYIKHKKNDTKHKQQKDTIH
jgi:hypothetical protein